MHHCPCRLIDAHDHENDDGDDKYRGFPQCVPIVMISCIDSSIELSKPPPEGAACHVAGSTYKLTLQMILPTKRLKNGQTMWGKHQRSVKMPNTKIDNQYTYLIPFCRIVMNFVTDTSPQIPS